MGELRGLLFRTAGLAADFGRRHEPGVADAASSATTYAGSAGRSGSGPPRGPAFRSQTEVSQSAATAAGTPPPMTKPK